MATLQFPADKGNAFSHHHHYLSGDATFTSAGLNFSTNNYIVCVNLNGKTLTTGGVALPSNYGSYISVMDSAATDGTLIGKASSNGSAINMTNKNGVVDIYGGTLKSSGAGAVVGIGGNGGVINMYGGKIQVTGDAGIAFSVACENAATVAQYFEATGAKQAVEANTENNAVNPSKDDIDIPLDLPL